MELREFVPDDTSAIEAVVEIGNACRAVDAPWLHPDTPYRRRMEMTHGWDGEPGRHFLAYDGAAPVGSVVVNYSDYDNLDLAWLEVRVHPRHRRRGLGRTALEAAFSFAFHCLACGPFR